MEKVLGSYEVGNEPVPDWLKQELSKGRGRMFVEDGQVETLRVYGTSRTTDAKKGDVILLQKTGMVVVPKAAAERYIGKKRKVVEDGQ